MPITIEIDTDRVKRALDVVGDTLAGRALKRAISRAVDAASVAGSRAVREELNVGAAAVKRAMKIRKTNLEGLIYASARPSGLVNFGARQTQRGVTVKIHKGGARERFRHAFIATGRSGNVQVFNRAIEGGRPVPRLPIKRLSTASIASQLVKETPQGRMRDAATERFRETLQYELNRAIASKAER